MKIGIVGSGYVGLVTGCCLAEVGHQVTMIDFNEKLIDQLNKGQPHFYEPGLEDLLKKVLSTSRLNVRGPDMEGLSDSEIIMLAVGTPSCDGVIDLSYIKSACEAVAPIIKEMPEPASLVVKSTVVPGTTDTFVKDIFNRVGCPLYLGMNPEFLREGSAVEDFRKPDRLVLGADDDKTRERLEECYLPWSCDKVRSSTRTAEMVKYTNNVMLALQISATNELSRICAAVGGVDIRDVMEAVHLDKRWNPITDERRRIQPEILEYLKAGCGFGGSCFPKDVEAIRSLGRESGCSVDILNAVLSVNGSQPEEVSRILLNHVGDLKDKKVSVLGLSFKPNTDDVRKSTSLTIISDLLRKGAIVTAHDPVANEKAKEVLNTQEVTFVKEWKDACHQADVVVVATAWDCYKSLPEIVAEGLVVFDARGIFRRETFHSSISYLSIGYRPLQK